MTTRTALLLSAVAASAILAFPAVAQTASGAARAGEGEIIVTAQKREQLLIDVPQAITVVSGDQRG